MNDYKAADVAVYLLLQIDEVGNAISPYEARRAAWRMRQLAKEARSVADCADERDRPKGAEPHARADVFDAVANWYAKRGEEQS